jgi:hypothetical protein
MEIPRIANIPKFEDFEEGQLILVSQLVSKVDAISKVRSAIVLVVVILAVVFALTFVYFLGSPNATSFTSSLSKTSSAAPNTGLQLVISFNSTEIRPGNAVNLSVSARNILSTPNNKSSASDWALQTLGQGFGSCTPLNNSPFRIAAFLGYYTMANISQAKSLTVANPVGMYSCTAISQFFYVIFQPDSNNVDVYGCTGSSCQTTGPFPFFESYFQVAGYYTNSSSEIGTTTESYSYHPLGVGNYTVAVGDEWGDLTLLHFTVTI